MALALQTQSRFLGTWEKWRLLCVVFGQQEQVGVLGDVLRVPCWWVSRGRRRAAGGLIG